jgi:DNA-binding SARP family transcriptional activator
MRLFGEFALTVNGVDRTTSIPRRSRLLLALLALDPDEVHSRQRIAFRFWPDSSEDQARTNLRNALHHLRRAGSEVDAIVVVTPSTLALRASAVDVDVARFRAARAEHDVPGMIQAYSGDLLEDCYEDWVFDPRLRLRSDLLDALLQAAAASGPDALTAARELVRREPLVERHHRALIAAHTAVGDRAAARRAYDECARTLERELGVEPSPATREALVARGSPSGPAQTAARLDRGGRGRDAIGWYRQAAVEATRAGRHRDAVAHLERAVALTHDLPPSVGMPQELDLLSLFPPAVMGVEGFASDRLARVHQRATDLADRLGVELDPPLLRSIVVGELCRDRFEEASAAAERLRTMAQRDADRDLVSESTYLLGIAAFWSGDLDTAERHFRFVIEGFDPLDRTEHLVRFGQDPQVVCLSRLANVLWLRGREGEARRTCDQALEVATAVGDPFSQDVALVFAGALAVDLADVELARACLRRWDDGRPRAGPVALQQALLTGWVLTVDGDPARGIRRIRAVVTAMAGRNHAPGALALAHHTLVEACATAGDPAATIAAADRALALGGTALWKPRMARLRDEARRLVPSADE